MKRARKYINFLMITLKLCFVYSHWYSGEEKQQPTTSIDSESSVKPIVVTSPIECVLKCQRKLRKSYYDEEKGQCFCIENTEQLIYSKEESVGIFYQEIE
eukprot:TCONS_00026296-protein